jgi:hypothetical protein
MFLYSAMRKTRQKRAEKKYKSKKNCQHAAEEHGQAQYHA